MHSPGPPPDIPDIGEEVDCSFEVALPTAPDGDWIGIAGEGAVIQVSRAILERMASLAGTDWETEEERQALIRRSRAKGILTAADGAPGRNIPARELEDGIYLVAELLEAGRAAVLPAGSPEHADRTVVRYRGDHPDDLLGSGDILFSLPPPHGTFLTLSWYVC